MIASSVGSIAARELGQAQAAVVIGETSRGVFLQLASGWVIFLSLESHRGPLTINFSAADCAPGGIPLPGASTDSPGLTEQITLSPACHSRDSNYDAPGVTNTPHRHCEKGVLCPPKQSVISGGIPLPGASTAFQKPIEVAPLPQSIFISPHTSLVDLKQAAIWSAPDRPAHLAPPHERTAQFSAVGTILVDTKPAAGFSSLLPLLSGGRTGLETSDPLQLRYLQLKSSLSTRNIPSILRAAQPFVGYGNGLTPSGDDLLLGLLLALNRWGDVLASGLDITALNTGMLQLTMHITTALSANLIACTAEGQADERLVMALDGLMTGHPDAHACAEALAAWGNSSGMDAFIGFSAAQSLTLSC